MTYKNRQDMDITAVGITLKSFIIKFWTYILPVVVFFFDPNQAKLILSLSVLMGFDTIVAGYYYYMIDKWHKQSFWKGAVGKIFKYFGALAAVRILEYFLVGIPYTQDLDTYVLGVLALTEFTSFYGYLRKFGLNVPILPKIKKLADSLDESINK